MRDVRLALMVNGVTDLPSVEQARDDLDALLVSDLAPVQSDREELLSALGLR